MSRGVVAAPAIISIHGDGFTMERSLSPQEIRYYVLYWDKIVIPGNNLIYVGLPEEEILIETGVIERPRVAFQGAFGGADLGNAFAVAQSVVAKKLIEEDHEIDWVLHQIGNQINLPPDYRKSKNSLRLDIVNLLPVPSGDAAIVDIMEFKYRRADELNALHNTIDNAYTEALRCPDVNLGATAAIRELKRSIQDLDTVSREKWERISKFDFSVEFNLGGGQMVQNIACGAVFDFFSNPFTLPVGAIVGGVASVLRFKAHYTASFKAAENNSKLAYLSHATEEQILNR